MSTTYDEVPYEVFPYFQTHPRHLFTLGKIFGLSPALPKKARILEIACASGGNLIPIASVYPEAECVGLDPSLKQIEEGKAAIEALGLRNIRLLNCGIESFEGKEGLFDYIICHGLFSWISKETQDQLITQIKKHLAPQGIAFVSYNTLPGWNMVKTMRDMMLYHAQRFDNLPEKLTQAQAMLNFVKDNADPASSYGKFLKEEAEFFLSQGDSYKLHDHLADFNAPVYFHEAMERFHGAGLSYLADTDIQSMFTGNLPEKAREALQPLDGDIVATEQYIDFMTNRRFRHTLLCHQGVAIDRNLSAEKFEDCYIYSGLSTQQKIDLENLKDPIVFSSSSGRTLTASHPYVAALGLVLSEKSDLLSVSEWVHMAAQKLKGADEGDLKPLALDLAMRLFVSGMAHIQFEPFDHPVEISKQPKAFPLAQFQARNLSWVTNLRHEKIDSLGLEHRLVLQYLDGTHDLAVVTDKMMDHLKKGEIILSQEGKPLAADSPEAREKMQALVESVAGDFSRHALLCA